MLEYIYKMNMFDPEQSNEKTDKKIKIWDNRIKHDYIKYQPHHK